MGKNRVVITGMGAVSPYGTGVDALIRGLRSNRSAISFLGPEDAVVGMTARLGGKVPDFDGKVLPREYRRSMPRVALLAFAAASEALALAGVEPSLPLAPAFARTGLSIGTTLGSSASLDDFFSGFLPQRSVEGARGSLFFKIIGHSVPSNLAVAFGLTGRCLAPAAACAAGLQAVGLGFECVASGAEEAMLCGGAEEFHSLLPATFDKLGAASLSDDPEQASRPFDRARNGIVCGEGAGLLLLETPERAAARHAPVLAEVLGFASVTSPGSIVSPDSEAIFRCMAAALGQAGLKPGDIAFVNAHATATEHGDVAEGQALARLFGSRTPVNSLKGHLSHTMAASGALELIAVLDAARANVFLPTRNLTQPDPACGGINLPVVEGPLIGSAVSSPDALVGPDAVHVDEGGRKAVHIMKNSFGLGGVNASLVVRVFLDPNVSGKKLFHHS